MKRTLAAAALVFSILVFSAYARAQEPPTATGRTETKTPEIPPAPKASSTHHQIVLDGNTLPYTATAGTIDLHNDKDDVIGRMFYVAYTEDGVKSEKSRPVTFLYNGGPGSSTIWLHMGSVGPVRVVTSDGQPTPPPPYTVADNPSSLLDKTDLVFVDAMGTGFSRILGKGTPKDFYGTDPDVAAFGQFIERYVTQNDRWQSPKFLFGESYGTTRSAALVNYLQDKGMAFNGVVLVSSYLDAYLDFPGPPFSIDLPYELYLPTMAATAWYHNKLDTKPADLPAFLEEVRKFALGDYARALDEGSHVSAADKTAIASRLHQYTGLPLSFIQNADLRISPDRFQKELLRGGRRTVGRLDARFEGIDHDAAGEYTEYDAADAAFSAAFTAAFHDYLLNQLKYTTDGTYNVTNYREVGMNWDDHHRVDYQKWDLPDVAEDLREAMTENPHLKVFSANGYFDFATPFFETEYTLDHMGLDPSLEKNVEYGYYQSGHMIYLHVPALKKLKADLAGFYNQATAHE